MATKPMFIINNITIRNKLSYLKPEEEEHALVRDEAQAHLIVHYFAVDTGGDTIADTIVQSVHRFPDSTRSSLKAFIQQNEPFPLEYIMKPEDAEQIRGLISLSAHIQVVNSAMTPRRKKKRPLLEVTIEILPVDVGDQVRRTFVGDYLNDGQEDHAPRADWRTSQMVKSVYAPAAGDDGGGEGGDYNDCAVCTVCTEEMTVGEEIVRTPCNHQFHVHCIRRWFEGAWSCPLCRLVFEQLAWPRTYFFSHFFLHISSSRHTGSQWRLFFKPLMCI